MFKLIQQAIKGVMLIIKNLNIKFNLLIRENIFK